MKLSFPDSALGGDADADIVFYAIATEKDRNEEEIRREFRDMENQIDFEYLSPGGEDSDGMDVDVDTIVDEEASVPSPLPPVIAEEQKQALIAKELKKEREVKHIDGTSPKNSALAKSLTQVLFAASASYIPASIANSTSIHSRFSTSISDRSPNPIVQYGPEPGLCV